MGLPVVVTDIRGCRQVVEHTRTGFLVAVRDADAMARAITTLASDPVLRADMGTAAREKAEAEFDDQRVIGITLDVYARLLGRRPTIAAA